MFGKSRKEEEVFADLSRLCATPGYIHVLAFLSVRDSLFAVKNEGGFETLEALYEGANLLRTESNLLAGLMLKQDIDFTFPEPANLAKLVLETENLLQELHHAIAAPGFEDWTPENMAKADFNPLARGEALREAIFYGGEPAYSFQYREFLVPKFSADNEWLLAKKGFSIDDCRTVISAITEMMAQNAMETLEQTKAKKAEEIAYLPCVQFTEEQVVENSSLPSAVVTNVLNAFTMAANERNTAYNAAQDDNALSKFPLIKIEDKYTLFNSYNLAETAYQAPFFWMWADKAYQPTAMEHRGKYTEDFATKRLAAVFGKENVRTGINIVAGKKVVGEVDVLVTFGDRLVILQAKSKQLTMAARRGSDQHLQTDFQAAVQDACDQGIDCAKHILGKNVSLQDSEGNDIPLPEDIHKIYLVCLIADNYPALSAQVTQFLKFEKLLDVAAACVMDVFFLDVMAEMLDSPLHFLNYLDRRAYYHDRFSSAFELTILALHLTQNLYIEHESALVVLDDTIANPLNTAMFARREGFPGAKTPIGILTKLTDTTLGKLVQQIGSESNAALISFGLTVLSMDEETTRMLSQGLDSMTAATRNDKGMHTLTVQLEKQGDGFTAMSSFDIQDVAIEKLTSLCTLRKYKQKTPRWHGVLLNPTTGIIDFAGVLDYKWERDPELEKRAQKLGGTNLLSKQEFVQRVVPEKTGRNDPCTCGSGKKYKKCCGKEA